MTEISLDQGGYTILPAIFQGFPGATFSQFQGYSRDIPGAPMSGKRTIFNWTIVYWKIAHQTFLSQTFTAEDKMTTDNQNFNAYLHY